VDVTPSNAFVPEPIAESGQQTEVRRPAADALLAFSVQTDPSMYGFRDSVNTDEVKHGADNDSAHLRHFEADRLGCLHTSMPSMYWPIYSCTSCPGIIYMCTQCLNWTCLDCGFSMAGDVGRGSVSSDFTSYSTQSATGFDMSLGPSVYSARLSMGYDAEADPLGSLPRYSLGYGTEAVGDSSLLVSDVQPPPESFPRYVLKQGDTAAWVSDDYYTFPA